MCLAIPLKIININGNEAVGELNGIEKNIRIDMIKNINIGEYVLVHAGFAINKIQNNDAEELIGYINEIGGGGI